MSIGEHPPAVLIILATTSADWRTPWAGPLYVFFSFPATLVDEVDTVPKVSWIGSANMTHAHITKIEDARTGQWLRHLDPITDPIKRIDMGWTMGDWNQLDVDIKTVALRMFDHYLYNWLMSWLDV